MYLSIIIPFYNEQENAASLCSEINVVLANISESYELILVNDGSKDGTLDVLHKLSSDDPNIIIVDLLRNYGQTAAMMAGFDYARGEIIIAMDGDGQNDPASIPELLKKLEEGYDVVSGWRKDRKDKAITRKLPSKIANKLISKVSGVKLNDYGCSLKAYRRSVISDVRLYGEMHRFIPIYSAWQGAKITEIPVKHRARLHGETKYGLNRIFKVMLDLLLVSFMGRYITKPIYVFGGMGLVLLLASSLSAVWAVGLKLFDDTSFISTPLPVLAGTFFTTGVLCILMGLLAEIVIRTYFEAQNKPIYQVKLLSSRDKN